MHEVTLKLKWNRDQIGDDSTTQSVARRAVGFIGEYRNRDYLRNWAKTGTLQNLEADVAEAYGVLDIGDRTLDDEIVIIIYHSRLEEAPARSQEFRAALQAIGKDRGSHKILSHLDPEAAPDVISVDKPVGLENIGNTC